MTRRLHGNNARTTLATTINALSTSITFASTTGFPAIGTGEVFRVTLQQGTKREIIEITDDASAPTYTCTRAMEGTTAQAFTSGASIELRATKDSLDRKQDTIATAGDAIDFGAATSLKIPNSAAPTVDAVGKIALDTTVTDFADGFIKYYSGTTVYGLIAMPLSNFSSPTDGYVVTYDAATDQFKLAAGGGGGGTPGGANTQVQYNNAGAFGGNSGFTYDGAGGVAVSASIIVGGNATAAGFIRLLEDSDNGSNYTGFQAPSALAANVVYTLPTADGASGEVLSTNGSGTLSWIAAGGGSGDVTEVQGTTNEIDVASGTGPIPVVGLADNPVVPGTAGMAVPAGTTAQRGSTNWQIRGNTDLFRLEVRIGGSWTGGQILIDGDFSGTGIMHRTGAGTYGIYSNTPITTLASLTDPNADRIYFWDDSASSTAHLTVGTGLQISGTTLSTATPYFRAQRGSNQSLSNSTNTKIQFNTEDFDSNGFFDNATNYRFQPTIAGKYQISAILNYETSASGVCHVQIWKNGSLYTVVVIELNSANNKSASIFDIIDFNGSSDYIEIYGFQNSGGAKNVLAGSFVAGHYIGA